MKLGIVLAGALRFVHFVDKLYDLEVRFEAPAACTLASLLPPAYAAGPVAAKYGRCRSRLAELLST